MTTSPWELAADFQRTAEAVAEIINRRPDPLTEWVRSRHEIQRLAQVAAAVHLNAQKKPPNLDW